MNIRKISSLLFAGILCLSPIGVKAAQMYAESEDGKTVYTSIDDAWDAAQNGTKIIMSSDWNISSRLVLDSNKTATIEMNGHRISRGLGDSKTNGEVIKLCSKSTLNLNGTKQPNTSFAISYLDSDTQIESSATVQSGGLITGGYSSNGGGGIHMKSGSTLNLDSVAISGNNTERSWGSDGHGAGIFMDGESDSLVLKNAQISYNFADYDGGGVYVNNKKSSITMTNSKIYHNSAHKAISVHGNDVGYGGGIAIDAQDVTVTLNENSEISSNYAHGYGGGIYSNAKNTKINLNASSINNNYSNNYGGGIYFVYSNFEVKSENKDGKIDQNQTSTTAGNCGGGIYAERCVFSDNKGLIEGITFTHNTAISYGGALNIHQEYVTVSNCNFYENEAAYAGAIYVANDEFVLENCTVKNNITKDQLGTPYTGAVHVDFYNDITLKGVINITNNKNSKMDCDNDLILNDNEFYVYAYILSAPDAGSKIGITASTDHVFAKNQNSNATDIYYINNSNEYTVSYDESKNEVSTIKQTSNEVETTTTTSDENQIYTVTLNMVNDAGTWQNTQKMTIDANTPFELQAPAVEDKEFVEFKDVPETLTVEDNTIKSDSISEDVELTLVYSDENSESLETSSIFGDGNTIVATVIIVVVVILGTFIFMKKKKSS